MHFFSPFYCARSDGSERENVWQFLPFRHEIQITRAALVSNPEQTRVDCVYG